MFHLKKSRLRPRCRGVSKHIKKWSREELRNITDITNNNWEYDKRKIIHAMCIMLCFDIAMKINQLSNIVAGIPKKKYTWPCQCWSHLWHNTLLSYLRLLITPSVRMFLSSFPICALFPLVAQSSGLWGHLEWHKAVGACMLEVPVLHLSPRCQ